MFVDRGQPLQRARRHRVRAVDRRDRRGSTTPTTGMVRPTDNNFAGIGACDSCGTGFGFTQRVERRARAVAAAAQLRRRQLARHQHPRSARARALGQHAGDGQLQLRPLLRQGRRAAVERHGQRQLGDRAELRAPSSCSVYNQMLTFNGLPGQCPPDGLLFGAAHRGRAVPGEPAPTGPRHRRDARAAATYVLNGNGTVTAFNGAPFFGSPPLADVRLFRDIAAMPDGAGLRRARRATASCTSSVRPPIPRTVGTARHGRTSRATTSRARSR